MDEANSVPAYVVVIKVRDIFFDPVTFSPIHSFRSNLLRGIIAIANIIPYLHKLTVLNSVGINR